MCGPEIDDQGAVETFISKDALLVHHWPPHNPYAERGLLVILLRNPVLSYTWADLLSPDDLYIEEYRDIFQCIYELTTIPVDPTPEEVKGYGSGPGRSRDSEHFAAFFDRRVDRLLEAQADPRMATLFGEAIRQHAIAREMLAICKRAVEACVTLPRGASPRSVLLETIDSLDDLSRRKTGYGSDLGGKLEQLRDLSQFFPCPDITRPAFKPKAPVIADGT